jgi:hypothetical protein
MDRHGLLLWRGLCIHRILLLLITTHLSRLIAFVVMSVLSVILIQITTWRVGLSE